MRTTLKRALVAGAVAVSIGVPVGAYAVTRAPDPGEPGTAETSRPPRQQDRDCDAPAEVSAILEDAAIRALRDAHRAEVTELREQWRANSDTEDREAFRAEMAALREEHREEVLAAVAELDADAAAWLDAHWAEMGGAGLGHGAGLGQGAGLGHGRARGLTDADRPFDGGARGFRHGGIQEPLGTG